MKWKPEIIVLSGGGVKGFLELGVLEYLEENNLLDSVTEYVGVSVGAIISLLLVVGYTPKEIMIKAVDINLFVNPITFFHCLKEHMGLFSSNSIRKELEDSIIEKLGISPTLEQLYLMTGKELVIVSYNLDLERSEHFSHLTEPKILAIDAAMMSMNIPLFFEYIKYKEYIYIDGGLHDPYPLLPYDQGKKILGIFIHTASDTKDITGYILKILHSLVKKQRDEVVERSSNNCKHLLLNSIVRDTMGISVSIKDKAAMIVHGYQETKKFFEDIESEESTVIK